MDVHTSEVGVRALRLDRGRVAAALDGVWQRMLKLDATETVVQAAGDVAQVHRLRGV